MNALSALFSGLLLGLGLIVSGMSNPAKVLGFLDLGGNWDPSLALVMAGAIAMGLIAFKVGGGRVTSLLGNPMQLPAIGKIDTRLVFGSALFGYLAGHGSNEGDCLRCSDAFRHGAL
jgi:uncharacterized membrane protein YedE/YeeE